MRIRYMRANFIGPYLLHITRAACTLFGQFEKTFFHLKAQNMLKHVHFYNLNMPRHTQKLNETLE
jgi:hypothetical protein